MTVAIPRILRRVACLLPLTVLPVHALALEPAEGASCPQHELLREAPEASQGDDLILNADQLQMDADGVSRLAGGVRLRQGGQQFRTGAMSYDHQNRVARVDGESLFRNDNIVIQSERAEFDLNAQSGFFEGTRFALPGRAARGGAGRLEIDSQARATLEGASYTTCPESAEAWSLEAARIHLDHEEGLGSARNARLKFMGVPILYLPWFQFPITDARRTGLLYPTVGQLSGAGTDVRWPVYLNLAPNYDLTLTPRLLSERGVQAGSEFRYLLRQHEGSAQFEYLDDSKFGDDRSFLRFDHQGLFSERLGVAAYYAGTSDRTYFEDLGGDFSSTSSTHLEQSAILTYQAPASYTVRAMVQNFQPIASNLTAADDPYRRLPQVRLDVLTRNSLLGARAGLGAEFVNFARSDSVEGGRLVLEPFLRYRKDAPAWYVQGQADLHYTHYQLSGVAAGDADNHSRSLPVISAESGLRFERVTRGGKLQLLTPRAMVLYVPYDNQDEIPLFDTGEPDFDFVQLFARNRFSGEDRIADARHLAGEVTLRELDPETGRDRWTVSAGQLYRLSTPRVTIPGQPEPERGATDFVGQVTYRLLQNWQSVVAGQWSPEDNRFQRTQVGVRYRGPGGSRQFSASYRYRRDLIEQADVSFLTPVWGPWSLAARTRYSLRDSRSRENFVGIEYRTCCWAIRTSWRRYIGDVSGDFDSALYVQLQLNGLANLGSGGESLLPDDELDGEYRR